MRPRQKPLEYGQTPLVYAGGWVAMTIAVLAQSTLFTDQLFTVKLLGLLALALPVSLALRKRPVNRQHVNFVVFVTALVLGVIELRQDFVPAQNMVRGVRGLMIGLSDARLLFLLIRIFCWIMVFRAFALLDDRDVVLSVVPAASIIVLVVVLNRSPVLIIHTFVLTCAIVLLLALDHGSGVVQASPQGAPPDGFQLYLLNTWASALVWVWLVTAVVFASVISFDWPQQAVRRVRILAAYRISRALLSANRMGYNAPSARLELAGPGPNLGKAVVMRVSAARPALWRGEVYSKYRGRYWEKDWPRKRHVELTGGLDHIGPIPSKNKRTDIFTQNVTAVLPMCGILYAAYRPVMLQTDALPRVIVDKGSDVLTTSRVIHPGEEYAAVSVRVEPATAGTRYTAEDHLGDLEKQGYLDVEAVPERVIDLARKVTRGARTPYEKATAIQEYLGANYSYSERTPPLPSGADFAEHFLFRLRRGNCNHFASAMAIMCRAAGIPARLATGFAAGERDETFGCYIVRENDAHAWVEAYLPAVGWAEFDPTPSRNVGPFRIRAKTWIAGVRKKTMDALVAAGAWLAMLPQVYGREARAALALAALGAICIGLAFLLRRRRERGIRPNRPVTPDGIVIETYYALCRTAARAGIEKSPAATAFEFGSELAERVAKAREPIERLIRLFVKAAYSGQPSDSAEATLAADALREAIPAISKWRRD